MIQLKPTNVKKLVFCTGKFYYDLLAEREVLNREDVAIVRIEQLFPLHLDKIQDIIKSTQMLKNTFGHKKNQKIWVLGAIW